MAISVQYVSDVKISMSVRRTVTLTVYPTVGTTAPALTPLAASPAPAGPDILTMWPILVAERWTSAKKGATHVMT